ncbi:HAD-IA family hydrolase [Glaciimonas sp. PCH181]|uniref:HAD-IA family hydrolase n=1 Tax=Glaciimonas sp. PCH181 TaxID=2133943 RepID=UPI000D3972A5|nr:HAD-IA family hydrolase [Glaciimonas sp. PCH181]PUA17579.1 sugar transferase [Glaciimonas sp. PCH181]
MFVPQFVNPAPVVESLKNAGIELIIFDSDGTLVDSELLAAEAMVAHVAAFGVTLTAPEVLDRFKGGKMADWVAAIEALRGAALPTSFEATLRERTAVLLQQRLKPIHGALELVQALKIPFCLASNGPREKIELCLGVTGLLPYFEQRIFSAYELGVWKPAPDLFLHAAAQMGVMPSRCAVVEDSIPGAQAGVAAGMRVFALQTGELEFGMPPQATVITRLADLLGHIGH